MTLSLTAIVEGLKSVARSKMNFWTGGLVEGGTRPIIVNEIGQEYVMNHRATAKNLTDLDKINTYNLSIEEYVHQFRPDIIEKGLKTKIQKQIEFLEFQKKAFIEDYLIEQKHSSRKQIEATEKQTRVLQNTIEVLGKKIEYLSDQVAHRETKTAMDVELHFDDAKYMKEIEKRKYAEVRSYT
jgi:hypothetical protein